MRHLVTGLCPSATTTIIISYTNINNDKINTYASSNTPTHNIYKMHFFNLCSSFYSLFLSLLLITKIVLDEGVYSIKMCNFKHHLTSLHLNILVHYDTTTFIYINNDLQPYHTHNYYTTYVMKDCFSYLARDFTNNLTALHITQYYSRVNIIMEHSSRYYYAHCIVCFFCGTFDSCTSLMEATYVFHNHHSIHLYLYVYLAISDYTYTTYYLHLQFHFHITILNTGLCSSAPTNIIISYTNFNNDKINTYASSDTPTHNIYMIHLFNLCSSTHSLFFSLLHIFKSVLGEGVYSFKMLNFKHHLIGLHSNILAQYNITTFISIKYDLQHYHTHTHCTTYVMNDCSSYLAHEFTNNSTAQHITQYNSKVNNIMEHSSHYYYVHCTIRFSCGTFDSCTSLIDTTHAFHNHQSIHPYVQHVISDYTYTTYYLHLQFHFQITILHHLNTSSQKTPSTHFTCMDNIKFIHTTIHTYYSHANGINMNNTYAHVMNITIQQLHLYHIQLKSKVLCISNHTRTKNYTNFILDLLRYLNPQHSNLLYTYLYDYILFYCSKQLRTSPIHYSLSIKYEVYTCSYVKKGKTSSQWGFDNHD